MRREDLEAVLLPGPAPARDSWRWATVTQSSPLRIRLDGDAEALPDAPVDLTGGAALHRRVRVLITGRHVEVHGVAGGPEWPGTSKVHSGATAPPGWLIEDGAAVSRATYAALFAEIGTTYGAGNGTTTFNVPDSRKRVPVGLDASDADFDTLGKTGGAKTHTLITAEMPAHSHPVRKGTAGLAFTQSSVNDGSVSNRFRLAEGTAALITTNTGGGEAHNNLQPYIVKNWIIKT